MKIKHFISEMKKVVSLSKPRKLRGWATYEGDEFTFKPSEQGEPAQLNVRAIKGGKLYETTSASKPQQVVHMSCSLDAADPFGVFVDMLQKLGIEPQNEQTLPEKQRLVCEGGMQVFLDAKQGLLSYQGVVDLTHSQNWQSELMRQLQVIMRTLPANKTFSSTVSKIKKGGKR